MATNAAKKLAKKAKRKFDKATEERAAKGESSEMEAGALVITV